MVKFEFLGKLKDRGDEEDGESAPSSDDIPVDEVRTLSDQGYSQHEINEFLRDRGYGYSQINKAMNRAVRDTTQGGGPGGGQSFDQGRDGTTQTQQQQGSGQDSYQPQPYEQDPGGRQPTQPQQEYEEGGMEDEWSDDVGISESEEELIETIVEEKIIDIEDEFENIYVQIEEMQDRLEDMQDDVEELQIRKDEDEQEFIQKVDEMEEYLETSQSRIGGLEKAFQQTLPTLVDNVRDLTDLVKDMKEDQR